MMADLADSDLDLLLECDTIYSDEENTNTESASEVNFVCVLLYSKKDLHAKSL